MKYLTVVQDLDSGAIVFIGPGEGAPALGPYWRRLTGSKARGDVATEMSPAYADAVFVSSSEPSAGVV